MAARATSKKPASTKKKRKSSSSSKAVAAKTRAPRVAAKRPSAKPKAKAKAPPQSGTRKIARKTSAKKKPAQKNDKTKRPKTKAQPTTKAAPARTETRIGLRAQANGAKAGSPPAERTTTSKREVPVASPSERVLATCAELPTERSLTDEEREALAKVSETARRFVGAEGAPSAIVESIASFVDDVRSGRREEPKSQDVRLGLGVLWGEQLRAQIGWRWVHLTYPDGFASYAVVPDDRAFACFPLNRLPEALRPGATSNRSAHVFDSIVRGTLPTRKPNAYLVIG